MTKCLTSFLFFYLDDVSARWFCQFTNYGILNLTSQHGSLYSGVSRCRDHWPNCNRLENDWQLRRGLDSWRGRSNETISISTGSPVIVDILGTTWQGRLESLCNKGPTSDSSWRFLTFGYKRIKTGQNDSCGWMAWNYSVPNTQLYMTRGIFRLHDTIRHSPLTCRTVMIRLVYLLLPLKNFKNDWLK